MPPDNQRWLNSPAHADTLLRILLQPSDPGEPAADVDERQQPNAQLLVTSKQTPDETGHPEQNSDNNGPDPGSKTDGAATQQPVRTYHAHALILRRQSAYFDASLGEVWQQQQQKEQQQQQPKQQSTQKTKKMKKKRQQKRQQSKHQQQQGATPASAPGAPVTLDLHRPQYNALLRDVKEAARKVLSQSTTVSDPIMLDACKHYIIHEYGDVPAVIRSGQRKQFHSLPFQAVLAWAASDELQVHSENCVVYLLSTWVQAAQCLGGQGVSAEQLEQLAQQVRVLHLGPAYQHHVMPQLGWFKNCKCSVHLPTLLALKGKDDYGSPAFPGLVDFPVKSRKFPAQWVAKARQRSRVTADRVVRWEMGDEQLKQLLKGKQVHSPPLYLNGFLLRMTADTGASADGAKTLGLYVGVDRVQAEGAISWPDTAAVKIGAVDLKVLHGPAGGASRKMSRIVWVGTAGRGYDMLSMPAPSASDLVAPYLRDGKLHVEAWLTTVDQP